MACGYDDSIFLNLPCDKSLECPVCMSVLRDPHLLSCCGSHVCQVSDISIYIYIHMYSIIIIRTLRFQLPKTMIKNYC